MPKNLAMSCSFALLAVLFVWLFWLQQSSGLKRADEALKAEIANSPTKTVQQVVVASSPMNDASPVASEPVPSKPVASPKTITPLSKPILQEKIQSSMLAPQNFESAPQAEEKTTAIIADSTPPENIEPIVTEPAEPPVTESKPVEVWLRIDGGSFAELQYPGSDIVRIAISKIESRIPYDVQVNVSHLAVKANQRYFVRFRARSDSYRSMYVGFSRSHDAWYGLGFYKKIGLTPDWQEFLEEFRPTEDTVNGRIHFDLGDNAIVVELAIIQLITLSSD